IPPPSVVAHCESTSAHSATARSAIRPKHNPDEPHLSHSQCRSYAGCSLAWWLSRRCDPEFVASNLIFGASFHAALDAYYQARLEGREAVLEDLLIAFTKHWADELAGQQGHPPLPVKYTAKEEGEAGMRALAERMLAAFLEHQRQQPSEVIAIEEHFRVEVDSNLPPLVGRIDLIEIVTGGDGKRKLCLTDFKTAARKPSLDDIGMDQLLIYGKAAVGLGLVNAFRLPLELRYLVVTKTKNPEVITVPVSSSPRDWPRLAEKIRQCWRGMRAGVVFPSPSWRCSGCGYAKLCGQWPAVKTVPKRQAA
ncbi:MAG: PD-(D/E)XK nuclease family protein, partial [Planctomycetes bacterium]|nr:PD-(D/E)XK nuclease family protein [Planctomycetota bacterium]